jgi:hypothetical protein
VGEEVVVVVGGGGMVLGVVRLEVEGVGNFYGADYELPIGLYYLELYNLLSNYIITSYLS